MVESVCTLHVNNILHCDLKPSNFVVCKGSALKIIDFGISKWLVDETDVVPVDKEHQVGTVNYMAPEALLSRPSDSPIDEELTRSSFVYMGTPSDVWSLGCILYEMIYRAPPFAHVLSLREKASEIVDMNSEVSFPRAPHEGCIKWIPVLEKCLAKKVENRISSRLLLSLTLSVVGKTR